MIHIAGKNYKITEDYREGFNAEAFRERYSEVLDRYDYIVGDWGYSQLRLKGFYKDGNEKAPKESLISSLQDYLNEYCNFGCAYFVVERVSGGSPETAGRSEHSDSRESSDSASLA